RATADGISRLGERISSTSAKRIQRNEYSSVSFRRLTSSNTTSSSSTLTVSATIWIRSVTGSSFDPTAERHDDHGEHDAGDRRRHAAGRKRCASRETVPRANRYLDHGQGIAAQKEPQLGFRIPGRMVLRQHTNRPATDDVVTTPCGVPKTGAHRTSDPEALGKTQPSHVESIEQPTRVVGRSVVDHEDIDIWTAGPHLGDDGGHIRRLVVRRNQAEDAHRPHWPGSPSFREVRLAHAPRRRRRPRAHAVARH